uniref:Uncharacterized protein n=1 Tax=Magallana gigas TaxID=29159 RepID=K1RNA9_MAGGI
MRYHLRSIYHLNQLSLENQLQKLLCNHEIQPNNNYIDPGSLKFVSHLPCDKSAQSYLSTIEPAPVPTSEFSSLTSDPSFISSAIVSSSYVISTFQSSSLSLLPSTVVSSIEPSSIISSAALSPIFTFVFGSSVAPSCPCDIRASAATETEDSVSSLSSFHSATAEENDLKHFIENISVKIERCGESKAE